MHEGLHILPEPFLWHPVAVHFPLALLTLGWAAAWSTKLIRSTPAWVTEAVSWCLWLGTLGAWAAVLLGLLAEDLAPHVPSAWEVLADHKSLGIWTALSFTFLSLWRLFSRDKQVWVFLLLWTGAAGLLIATGMHGGWLVYHFGMGVLKH
jgi:uncharacterized membrane protein